MDRGAWWATVHGVARVGPELPTKPPPPISPATTTFFVTPRASNWNGEGRQGSIY